MEIQELAARFDTHHEAVKGILTAAGAKHDGLAARFDDLEQKLARRGGGGDMAPSSWGKAMVESDQFKALAIAGRGSARIEVKTTLTTAGASGLVPSHEQVDPIVLPRRRLGIRDLLSRGQTTSNAIKYVEMTSRSNSARVQSEGTPKAEQALEFTPHTADVTTIAAWLPASKQILDDGPALMALIDAELRYAVDFAEEEEILGGDGSGEHLFGLIPQATAFVAPFTPDAPQMIDTILLAKAQLEVADLTATGVVLNPLDWAKIRSLKDGEGRYIIGTPLADVQPRLWDIAVVASNGMAEDTFLLGDFKRAAILFELQTMTIEVSTEHSDFFTRNLVAIRGEKRVALAVQQPAATIPWGLRLDDLSGLGSRPWLTAASPHRSPAFSRRAGRRRSPSRAPVTMASGAACALPDTDGHKRTRPPRVSCRPPFINSAPSDRPGSKGSANSRMPGPSGAYVVAGQCRTTLEGGTIHASSAPLSAGRPGIAHATPRIIAPRLGRPPRRGATRAGLQLPRNLAPGADARSGRSRRPTGVSRGSVGSPAQPATGTHAAGGYAGRKLETPALSRTGAPAMRRFSILRGKICDDED